MVPSHHRRGFTLIEALVALLLASAGLLGIARLQAAVSVDGGQSAQRLEAQRLLSSKIEELRSMDGAQLRQLASSNDTPNSDTNTRYTRRWSLGPVQETTGSRPLTVSVEWSDRQDKLQTLRSTTLVQMPEGQTLAAMTQPLDSRQAIRGPRDRFIDIHLPAQLVGDGTSSFTITPQNSTTQRVTFVIDNSSGKVLQRCPSSPTGIPSLTQILNGVAGCQAYDGVVLSGFLGGRNQTLTALRIVDLNFPSSVLTNKITGRDPNRNPECELSEFSSNANQFLSINGSATYRYICVIPLTANSSGWSGHLEFGGALSLSLSSQICRFQYPNAPGTDPNRRNVQDYQRVTGSLFNQNYFYVISPQTCNSLAPGLLVEHQACPALALNVVRVLPLLGAVPIVGELLDGCDFTGGA